METLDGELNDFQHRWYGPNKKKEQEKNRKRYLQRKAAREADPEAHAAYLARQRENAKQHKLNRRRQRAAGSECDWDYFEHTPEWQAQEDAETKLYRPVKVKVARPQGGTSEKFEIHPEFACILRERVLHCTGISI